MKITSRYSPGRDLKIGDILRVWWKPGRDQITELRPYVGPLGGLWHNDARTATFAVNELGMIIEPDLAYELA